MIRPVVFALFVGLFCAAPSLSHAAAKSGSPAERDGVAEALRWNLADLYANAAAWEADFKKLDSQVNALAGCQKTMSRNAGALADCLDARWSAQKRFDRLRVYANRTHDQDARKAGGQELHARIGQMSTRLGAATAFFAPGILAIKPPRLKKWLRTKRLSTYAHRIDDITRRRKHVLTPEMEKLLASAGDLGRVPESIYQSLATVNIPWPNVKLSGGRVVKLTRAAYSLHRAAPNRADRIAVFAVFWRTHKEFRETFAGLLAGVVARDRFHATSRGYRSDVAASLDASNVPEKVYRNMITQVRAGRKLLWRYLKLRKKLLNLETLGYHDLYVSIVPKVNWPFPFTEARKLIEGSTRPLGADYVKIMAKAFDERWMDVLPTAGKRSGAYMSGGAYDVHPYVLLNYNDDYDSLSTTAHELGHAAHSFLANKRQRFHDADYPTFTAEIASTLNEDLLRLHMLKGEKDDKRRLYLLGQYLDGWRTTVFRQAIFAEFELRIHELARAGKPLTADLLDSTYLELLKSWYGHKEKVTRIHDHYAAEWAYIPHFYYNFYMFQYTTSFIAGTAIARDIHKGDKKARGRYLEMLAAGGSRYPADLLAIAGVDMSKAAPYNTAFASLRKALVAKGVGGR